MAGKQNGVIDKMARNGKAFTLVDDSDTWYSVFDVSQMGTASVGADIEFTYTTKDNGGRQFNNIKGNVRVINPGVGTSVPSSPAISGTSKALTFGDITLSRDRCIARQNACNVAASLMRGTFELSTMKGSVDEYGHAVVHLAKIIEDYTTGDLDKAEAKAKMEVAVTPEVEVAPNVLEAFEED